MWTTDRWRYVLVRGDGYLPIDVSGTEPMAVLIDEDDELAAAVAEAMRDAGVPVVDDLKDVGRVTPPCDQPEN